MDLFLLLLGEKLVSHIELGVLLYLAVALVSCSICVWQWFYVLQVDNLILLH
jgi:hypothetical protein